MSEQPVSRFAPRMFSGDYEIEDEPTFRGDLAKVRTFFLGHTGCYYSKEEIRIGAGLAMGKDPTPRVRDLRKEQFGNWQILKKKIDNQYRYQFTGKKNEKEKAWQDEAV